MCMPEILQIQSSQTAAIFLSSSLAFSFSSSRLLLSFSRTALSYSLCSGVIFGALTPKAPAIKRDAAAADFSGLLSLDCGLVARVVVGEKAPPEEKVGIVGLE